MDNDDLQTLALYNTETSRGLLHDAEWQKKMAELQAQFDEERKPRLVVVNG